MARALTAVAEEGVLACAREDQGTVLLLLLELIAGLDLGHPAARTFCRVYEAAVHGVGRGSYVTARGLFRILREL